MQDAETESHGASDSQHLVLNLVAIHGRFSIALQRLLDSYTAAAVGLSKVDDQCISEFGPFFRFSPAVGAGLNHKDAADEAGRWLLRSIFRDSAELVHALIESYRFGCALARAAGGGETTGAVYNRIADAERKSFHQLPLPKKVETLRVEFGVRSDFEPHVLSFNRVRNCLVHRLGIVRDEDLKGESELKVTFRTIDLVSFSPDRQNERAFDHAGVRVEPGWSIDGRRTDKTRSFKLGEQISFTYRDVADTMLTLVAFSHSLVKAAYDYARAQGVPGPAPQGGSCDQG